MGKMEIRQLRELQKRGKKLRLAAEWKKPWQSLISTILSARTTDVKTNEVSKILYRKYGNIQKLAKASLKDIERIVHPVNFYRNKAKSISGLAKIIVRDYGGKIPKDFDKLLELPGVGRKTANVFLAHQGGAHIGVDTHVAYISRKLGWTHQSKPEKIEQDLEKIFPKRLWRSVNYVVVRFGQTYKSRREKDKILARVRGIK